jgi:hypothetical protein
MYRTAISSAQFGKKIPYLLFSFINSLHLLREPEELSRYNDELIAGRPVFEPW